VSRSHSLRASIVLSRILVPSLGVVLLFAGARLDAADRMVPGQWEFTMTTNGETSSVKTCITQELAASANGDTRSAREAAQRGAGTTCTISEFKVEGNVVSYSMKCADTTIGSTSTYHGESLEAVMKTKRGTAETTTAVKARRLGVCPK
jgi:Protein of unknown function (DUF3617)